MCHKKVLDNKDNAEAYISDSFASSGFLAVAYADGRSILTMNTDLL